MAENNKVIGNGPVIGNISKKLNLNIKNGSVTTDKIAAKAVTSGKIANNAITSEKVAEGQLNWAHLDKDTQNIIASREEGGVALSGEFGESTLIGIHQKKLSETFENLQGQIDTIVGKGAIVNLSATPSMVFVGDSLSINLVATTDLEATEISVRDDGTVIAEGSGIRLTCYKNIEITQPGITSFYASFTINGITKTTSATVTAVNKIYYGSGTVYTDAAIVPPAKLTPEGSYNVQVIEGGQYIFFNIPTYMMLNGATMNGFEFPLDEPTTVTIDNTEYKSYRSSNTVDAGTYEIIIS